MKENTAPPVIISVAPSVQVANHLNTAFGGTIKAIACALSEISMGVAKVMQLVASDEPTAISIIKTMMFNYLRIEMFDVARYSFRKIKHTIVDEVPLRFFIPFIFCEPESRWYKLAPFQIELEEKRMIQLKHTKIFSSNERVAVRLAVQVDTTMDTSDMSETHTHARVIFERSEITPARYNIRLNLPWLRRLFK